MPYIDDYTCETTRMGSSGQGQVTTSRQARRLVARGRRAQQRGEAAAVLTLRDHADGTTAVLMNWSDPKNAGPVYAYRTDRPVERWKPRFVRGELMLVEVDEDDQPLSRGGLVQVVRNI